MAIYEVVLRSLYYGQRCINVWHYVCPDGIGITSTALGLLTGMGFIPVGDPPELPDATIFAHLRGLTNDAVAYTEVEARNLYSVTDFYLAAYSPAVQGLVDGIDVSPAIAIGLFTNRVRTDIRRGFKRFVGLTEEQMTNGGALTSGAIGALAGLANAMTEPIDGGGFTFYQPAVLAFEKYTTTAPRVAYKQYPTEAEQLEHAAYPMTWAGYDFVRTQTSRQYGRGQ